MTRWLAEWRSGDGNALHHLAPLIYGELRRLAQSFMEGERQGHTLQATALVHEAFLRLADVDVEWQDRAHFFAVAARFMRRILVDHARRHRAVKRGGGERSLSLDAACLVPAPSPDLVELDDALKSLAAFDRRKSRVVELKFFGGLTIEETASVLGVSHATVERELKVAKAWLHREISNGPTVRR